MRQIKDYCVYDLETTGLSPVSDRIIEIGILRVRDGEVVSEYHTYINPEIPIPEKATSVNGITDSMICNAPRFPDIVSDVVKFIGTDTVVGYNNNKFDNAFMMEAFKRCGIWFLPNSIDVYILVKQYEKFYSLKFESHSLAKICEHFRIDTKNAHSAVADCYMTKACFDSLYIPVKA